MTSSRLAMAIDSGTTGTTVLIVDDAGRVVGRGYHEMPQHYPRPGWVEHDPEDIWKAAGVAAGLALENARKTPGDIAAIGITNQRETAILWDRATGKAVHKAIVWQCRRSAPVCEALRKQGLTDLFRSRTGLVLDAYFSGTKLTWLFKNHPELRKPAQRGELAFGTVDSWLLHKLTGGKAHRTDQTNASRTLMYNIHEKDWDDELLRHLKVPRAILPEVFPPAARFGTVTAGGPFGTGIRVAGIAGDQQAALYGQACFGPGEAKNTYGTGCFLLFNTGQRAVASGSGMLTTLAATSRGKACYALEGAIFSAGAAVQWLRDGLGLVGSARETGDLASGVPSTDGVYLVPAFTGLGAPYWDPDARGALLGLTRGTRREHVVRATLESMAYQVEEVLQCMQKDSRIRIKALKVDGGASENDFLMQFQSDLSGIPIDRPQHLESTAFGAAFLAGTEVGLWDPEELPRIRVTDRVFRPAMEPRARRGLIAGWKAAVSRVLTGSGVARS